MTADSCPPSVQLAFQFDAVQVCVQETQLKLLRTMQSHFVRSQLLARYRNIDRPAASDQADPATKKQL